MSEPAWEIKVLNDCLYCHKEYKPNNANHYCDDCVMVCDKCGELKGLWCFNFDFDSATYKEWKAKGCYGKLSKPGHKTTCGQCSENKDAIEALRQAVKKLKPGQLELMLQSQKK